MNLLKEVLTNEVFPAFGCTEPISCAYAAALAGAELGEPVESLLLRVDSGTYKNGAAVTVPHCDGAKGNLIAAALGAVLAKPEAKLDAEIDETDAVENDDEPDSGELPPLAKKDRAEVKELRTKAGKTSAPKRLSEADLLGAMQGAGKALDDEELRGAMKDSGLGTPATRAAIIETLLRRTYIERKRNVILPTEKGIALVQSLQAEALKSPQLTGDWEARLERMRRGGEARGAFMDQVRGFVAQLVGEIASSSNEQADGLSQISSGLSQIDEVVQRSASGAEQTASASAELAHNSEQVRKLMDRFRVRGGQEEPRARLSVVDHELVG